MPATTQGASGAVRKSILRRLAFRNREIDIATTIAPYTDPFPHSLGHKQPHALQHDR
jgi:hypothetical protein